jgi:hypothetical protein
MHFISNPVMMPLLLSLLLAGTLHVCSANYVRFDYDTADCTDQPKGFMYVGPTKTCQREADVPGSTRNGCRDGQFYATSYETLDCTGAGVPKSPVPGGVASPTSCTDRSRRYCTPLAEANIPTTKFSLVISDGSLDLTCKNISDGRIFGESLNFCFNDTINRQKLVQVDGQLVRNNYAYEDTDCTGELTTSYFENPIQCLVVWLFSPSTSSTIAVHIPPVTYTQILAQAGASDNSNGCILSKPSVVFVTAMLFVKSVIL